MEFITFILAGGAFFIWTIILLLPWQPWNINEIFYAEDSEIDQELKDITVLIPARNEVAVIKRTLQSVINQGKGINIILVDDETTDGTADIARDTVGISLQIIKGHPLPEGWVGKLWALEQGRKKLNTTYTVLLDADIELGSGVINKMLNHLNDNNIQFMSLMVTPTMISYWEKLLMPAFVYFFKLLYPFSLANNPISKVAAAAGGCIFMKTEIFEKIDGYNSIKSELIDDCSLAYQVKLAGYRTWIGLTHSACSIRSYKKLWDICEMIARNAFTQLRYSILLLILISVVMLLAFLIPVLILVTSQGGARYFAVGALLIMGLTYLPTLKFYYRSIIWVFNLPLIAFLYLAITWYSALRYWCGVRSQWKTRVYRSTTI